MGVTSRCELCGSPAERRFGLRASIPLEQSPWERAEMATACDADCGRLLDMAQAIRASLLFNAKEHGADSIEAVSVRLELDAHEWDMRRVAAAKRRRPHNEPRPSVESPAWRKLMLQRESEKPN